MGVWDFPPGCGPIVRPINVVPHESEPLSSPVTNNHVASDAGTDEPVGLIVESLVNNEMKNGDVQVDDGDSVIKETIPKMKFTPRRVSAVRDFPPYCGLNADEPTEEERRRINGRRSCGTKSNGSVKGEFVHETQPNESNESSVANQEMQKIVESNIDVKDEKVMKTEPSKKVQNIGQACQKLVVYTRDKVLKKASPVDDAHDVDYEEDDRDNKPLSLIQKDMNLRKQEVGSKKLVEKRPLDDTNYLVSTGGKIKVVMGLKAPLFCAPGIQEKDLTNKAKGHASITPKQSANKKQKNQEKVVAESTSTGKVAYTSTLEMVEKDLTNKKGDASKTPKSSVKKQQKNQKHVAFTGTLEMVVRNEEDFVADMEEKEEESLKSQGTHDLDVTLPPFGPKSSNDARNKVRETLRLFQTLCRKLLQGEEARTDDLPKRRVDLAAKAIMAKKGKVPELGKKTHGPVPGVEVGDEFQYRVELALVGIHRPFQGGIDYVKKGKDFYAVSVVASGGYANEVDKPDCLMYSGSGGIGKDKSYENQKLERGNLALNNNIERKYPVRVVRGDKVKPTESSDSKTKTYIYDGLYTVESCSQVTGPKGNMVYNFELKRVPGQPQLAIREVTSKKFKTRAGICVKDITDGKEVFPICAINTIDDEKPPVFTYITKIMYPDWYKPVPPKGCDCVGRCSDKKCSCALKNGGEIPYNRNGAIVEAQPLVYECGPSCRCPPSCYNRVTQRGMKIHLEIFKTESRGWGVRSLSSISSGSFICEYVGELLEETEAEKRTSNDEYLFDIGQNYNDCSLKPDTKPEEIVNTGGGFTIDAASYGNVGRFINHSCSPNLYAQNVLYDQDDNRMPHIMLFAAENISPLQELTYHYNYLVDTVHDADGNIKVKSCYCGSPECTGRLY
ncbi:hypothetical protein L1987_56392 [Smallanthus sonchifolius]|uniref:Uncharacterized protein n=1 Tax=Smallanthus sonchifolius TaxID=185202 RepID=A0ACB9ECR9_9ASTR|nr:hypothetical protein L1987_56392 [Smallanthus sonchifolius]